MVKEKNIVFVLRVLVFSVVVIILLTSCSDSTVEQESSEQMPDSSTSSQHDVSSDDVPEEVDGSEISDSEDDTVSIVKSASIENGAHESSADINLYSDNTLVLENFTYDGKGPDVYVAIGNKNGDGDFERLELVTEKLTREYTGEPITIQLSTDVEFNAVSIYCEAYSDDFGSTILQ